ncbi:Kelch repeat-containing protein [Ferrimonas gelatinilytica]|uniref:N-acetylneuraminic acid mutarotase n=1 Tax=Ferrimonas gelatinilytica TaxID=1255257 RepID=A0ABP9RZR6_9GAMM
MSFRDSFWRHLFFLGLALFTPFLHAQLLVSGSADRNGAVPLEGATLAANQYIFFQPSESISQVRFFLDQGTDGTLFQREGISPYDFSGTASGGLANPFITSNYADGAHYIVAEVTTTSGAVSQQRADFVIDNDLAPALDFSLTGTSLTLRTGESDSGSITLNSSDGSGVAAVISSDAAWLQPQQSSVTTPATVDYRVDATGLAPGNYSGELLAQSDGLTSGRFTVALTVSSDSSSYSLLVSRSPDRSGAVALELETVSGEIYVFVAPEGGIEQVRFFIDGASTPSQTERRAPYDLAGTQSNGLAIPFDTSALGSGSHSVLAEITTADGVDLVGASFVVGGDTPALQVSPTSLSVSTEAGSSPTNRNLSVSTSDGSDPVIAISENSGWFDAQVDNSGSGALITLQFATEALTPGSYSDTLFISADGYLGLSVPVDLTVNGASNTYQLMISTQADRSSADVLSDQTVNGDIYVFVMPENGISQARFFIDSATASGSPDQVENRAPFDMAGTASNGEAQPFDTSTLAAGSHPVTVSLDTGSGTEVISASFVTGTAQPSLTVSPTSLEFTADEGVSPAPKTLLVSPSDGASTVVTATDNVNWLSAVVDNGNSPISVLVQVDSTGLAPGSYGAEVTLQADGYLTSRVPVSLVISGGGGGGGSGDLCGLTPCESIRVTLPYRLDFDQASGGIEDRLGQGTGFTYLMESSQGGYRPALIDLNTQTERLTLTTTPGLNFRTTNSQDNALGVGFAGANQVAEVSARLVDPPSGSGNFEQAGIWFGYNEDHYVKLVYLSNGSSREVEMLYEWEGVAQTSQRVGVGDLSNDTLDLTFIVDPNELTLSGRYAINGGSQSELALLNLPPEFFSFDAAGIDPRIGTRTFAGVMASHRNGSAALDYTFEYFEVKASDGSNPGGGGGGGGGGSGDWSFSKTHTHPVSFPTSMVWGPNGKLYVTELFGTIHELTFNANREVISDVEIDALTNLHGNQLALGITVYHDNPQDPDDFSLWVNHSSPSTDNGEINSGIVTRISGSNWSNAEAMITGLPRAKANHGPNSLHFGSDDRLYIAIGGNTGAGAPVDPSIQDTEFGDREEQPLSAAILVADVFASGFDGTCDNQPDIFADNPCDVTTWVTGLRNAYDFVFHSNGEAYATDNGLGVTGAFPPSPSPSCFGFGDPRPVSQGGDNPGEQPDLLLRLESGAYYGHPNPSREECVFKDGSLQNTNPLPNFEEPMLELGSKLSSNGIIEYRSGRACGALQGNLMFTNYSRNDGVERLELDASGTSVVAREKLPVSMTDPLVLSEYRGDLYVAEFGAGQIAVLTLSSAPCWLERNNAPLALLDTGSALLNGELHLVGGKTQSGPQNGHFAFDPASGQWRTLASKPGAAVENPALAAYDGDLYLFGGSTSPFSGAQSDSYRYDAATDSWSSIAPMPEALGGIRAERIGDEILIAGGMNGSGDSVDSLWIYTPATDSWRSGPSMSQVRDNPGTAVLDGELYVIGGRERANGSEVDGTLASMEIYDPGTNQWRNADPLSNGRRTFAVGTVNGKLQVVGGERDTGSSSGVFPGVEQYDPATGQWQGLGNAEAPTHGAGFATVNDVMIIATGGTEAGSSFTNNTYQVSFE